MKRHQLPAYSPLPLRGVVRGAAALAIRRAAPEQALEVMVRERFGARAAVLTDSGTSALALALRAASRMRRGLPVAIPAYSCYDLATAADCAGVSVLLYDLDPATLGPDVDSLRTVVARGVSAVVVAHLYGIPVEMAMVRPIVEEAGAILVEDAAQGAGGRLAGRPLGTHGSVCVLSFGRGKGVTGGGGGALLAQDDEGAGMLEGVAAELAAPDRGRGDFVRAFGHWLLARPAVYAIPASVPFLKLGETVYNEPWPPRGISAVAARILSTNWPLDAAESGIRRRNAARLLEAAKSTPALGTIAVAASAEPGYLRLPVIAAPAAAAPSLADGARRLGIMPGYPKPLAELDRFRTRCLNADASFPGARLLARRLRTLPTHSRLRDRDLAALEAWIDALPRDPGG